MAIRNIRELGDDILRKKCREVKEVTPEQRKEIIERTAHDYMLYASWYGEEKQ